MDFCSQLSSKLLIDAVKKSTEKNLVVSPLSFNIILHLTAEGSSGSTLEKLKNVLDFKDIKDLNTSSAKMMDIASDGDATNGEPIIQLLDGVWIDQKYSLKPSHEEVLRSLYKAAVKRVDFQNKCQLEEIIKDANAWVKAATEGLIEDFLTRGDVVPDTNLIIGNALYFKGIWEGPFTREFTYNQNFYLLNGEKVSVPFMTGCRTYSHNSFDGFELVKIPYRKGKDGKKLFSMYIFLPNKTNGLEKLLQKAALDSAFLRQDFELKDYPHYNIFRIPKFKFSYQTSEVLDTMIEMGLPDPFVFDCINLQKGRNEMTNVTKILQKAFIEVDEEGTEAAAGSVLSGGGVGSNTTKFVADHPFMFMIREEETKLVLFTGAVLNPLQDSTNGNTQHVGSDQSKTGNKRKYGEHGGKEGKKHYALQD